MNNTIYTAVVIGTGRIGFSLGFDKKREQPASHTMALLSNNRIEIIAGCDSNKENLSEWEKYVSKKFRSKNLKTFSSVDELFSACKPDIVVIAVNEDAHLETAIKALESKPHLVILEKPVALNTKDGLKIEEVAKKCGVPVLVNHERRFAVDYGIAKNYLSEIGKIQSVRASLHSGLRVYSAENEKDGGYSLLHDGTHLVDIVNFLLDEPLKNPVITGVYHDEVNQNIIRNLSAHYETKNCPSVTIEISGRSRFFGFEVDVIGTEGRIQIGNGIHAFYKRKESKLYTGFYSLSEDKSVKIPKKTGYFSNMIQNAVDFLDGKATLKSTLQTGLEALSTLEEIKEILLDCEKQKALTESAEAERILK